MGRWPLWAQCLFFFFFSLPNCCLPGRRYISTGSSCSVACCRVARTHTYHGVRTNAHAYILVCTPAHPLCSLNVTRCSCPDDACLYVVYCVQQAPPSILADQRRKPSLVSSPGGLIGPVRSYIPPPGGNMFCSTRPGIAIPSLPKWISKRLLLILLLQVPALSLPFRWARSWVRDAPPLAAQCHAGCRCLASARHGQHVSADLMSPDMPAVAV